MASSIGIKVANGEFYPIVTENYLKKKRLVLTTVHNNQQSVQIDLYRSATKTMADASYIGSLVLENIKPRPSGDPSIELIISTNRSGHVVAEALDMDDKDGDHQTLSVSLQSIDEQSRESDLPDFDFDSSPPDGLLEKETESVYIERRKFPWLIVILAALILIAIGLVAWLFFFKGWGTSSVRPTSQTVQTAQSSPQSNPQSSAQSSQPPSPPQPATQTTQPTQAPQVSSSQPQTPPAPQIPTAPPPVTPPPSTTPVSQSPSPSVVPVPQTPPPVIQAPATQRPPVQTSRERVVPPVYSYNVPSVIPPEGVSYRIRYGDTLWDIAEAFYRNPWLYPRIARFNNIRNPDLIISGTTIRVPPRN